MALYDMPQPMDPETTAREPGPECRDVAVLDWNADILSRLEGYGCLVADRETGERLKKAFHQHINIPPIRVMGGAPCKSLM